MTKRTTISLPASLLEKAELLMQARDFNDFSGLIQTLIREEYERRHGPMTLQDKLTPPGKYPPHKRPKDC